MENKEKNQKVLRYAQLVFKAERGELPMSEQTEREALLQELSMSHREVLNCAASIISSSSDDVGSH